MWCLWVYLDHNALRLAERLLNFRRYPECCIRCKEPRVFLRCDQKALFSSFLEDLLSRLPSLCGAALKFTSISLHPTATIYSASLSKQTNLTRASTPSKSTQPFVFTAKNVSQDEFPRETSEKRLQITSSQNVFQENTSSVGVRQCEQKPYIPCFTKRRLSDNGLKTISTKNKEAEIQLSPLVPCFTTRKPVGGSSRKKTVGHGKRDMSCTTTKIQHTTMKNQALCCSNTSVPGDKEKFVIANNELEITKQATGNNMSIHQQSKDINLRVVSQPEPEQNRRRFICETVSMIYNRLACRSKS